MHTKDPTIAKLRQMPLFRACSKKDAARFAGVLTEVAVPAGDVLTREDVVEFEQCLLILEGEAVVSRAGTELAVLGPGSLVGEVATLTHGPRSATVRALTPLRVLVFDPRTFTTLLDSVPSVRSAVMGCMAARLRQGWLACRP
jgi:CRP/FNR family cyclic AMP-dependent transcriptional regulator